MAAAHRFLHPQAPGWRYERVLPSIGRAHFAGGAVVAALAWIAAAFAPDVSWLAWGEVRRAAVMLALLDLAVPISPFIGSAARHVREWSMAAWGLLVMLGVGPLIVTLIGG